MLYFIHQDEGNHVPSFIKQRVLEVLSTVSQTPDINPVARIIVVCTGNDGEVYIVEITSTI